MNLPLLGKIVPFFGLFIGFVILVSAGGEAADRDQSDLIVQRLTVENYNLFSTVNRKSLANFKCESSDYQNMIVCDQDKTGRETRKRITVTFDQNSGAVAYVFSYHSQRFGSLRPSFVRAVQQISAVVGPPREHVVTQLAGDQHQSHLVYWGSINSCRLRTRTD
jgi:hypothetical protein